MKYERIHTNTRRRAARFGAAPLFSTSPDSSVRKSAIRSRQFSEMEAIEDARSMLSAGPRSVGAAFVGRDGTNDIRSVANVQKISLLQEIFPDVAVDIMQDVLIAAQFRMDTAASMLSELSRELLKPSDEESPERGDLVFVDWATAQREVDGDEWHEVSASRPEMQQWVLVQDDWEVVDSESPNQDKTRSYADVLSSPVSASAVPRPPVTPATVTPSLSRLGRVKKTDPEPYTEEFEELSLKTFNTRKRRSLRKSRG